MDERYGGILDDAAGGRYQIAAPSPRRGQASVA